MYLPKSRESPGTVSLFFIFISLFSLVFAYLSRNQQDHRIILSIKGLDGRRERFVVSNSNNPEQASMERKLSQILTQLALAEGLGYTEGLESVRYPCSLGSLIKS